MDPNPGGPKIYGSYGSGSGTATLAFGIEVMLLIDRAAARRVPRLPAGPALQGIAADLV